MKRLVREYEFSPEELHSVRELAREVGVTETTASILYARGMDSGEKMRRFLAPSRENLLSPFLMSGMREAVELITRARDEEWRVVVYGDYDADGIGACAILSRALERFGIRPYLYVPEREEGYGLSLSAIDAIFDEFLPDLFITVDCGISCYRETEYIKEQGAYVIVTDHHELPERIPDCICINPKLKDDYPYDNLCGAGVAFKLATALIGREAEDLLDFCALSTVADSVPLVGENRDIVSEGLKLISRRPALAALMGKTAEPTAQTLAFTVAPRINAAGRMGDARSALRLFTTDDEEEILALAAKLQDYNVARQQLCDELYEKARAEIAAQGAYGNVVMLVGEDWHPGLIGIVAARIAEEYARPAILFVRRGDILRGSARSIESVNIFEALRASREWIEEFGGHSQAAGVNVREENLESLRRSLDEYIGKTYSPEDFIPTICVSGEIDGEFPYQLAQELNALEPYGVGNRRPLFVTHMGRTDAAPIKPASPHLAVTGGKLDFMYFGGAAERKLLRSDIPKEVVFECNLSTFRGRESLKGFIRAVVYDGSEGEEWKLDAFENLVLSLGCGRAETEKMGEEEIAALLKDRTERCAYGLCAIARERETLGAFPVLDDLPREIFRLSSGSVRNAVLIAPDTGLDLSAYRDVVYLETPAAAAQKTGNARLYANSDRCGWRQLRGLDISRGAMVEAFTALRAREGQPTGDSLAETARLFRGDADDRLMVFALAVFGELGLVDCTQGYLRVARGKRTELTNSKIYAAALALAAEE